MKCAILDVFNQPNFKFVSSHSIKEKPSKLPLFWDKGDVSAACPFSQCESGNMFQPFFLTVPF